MKVSMMSLAAVVAQVTALKGFSTGNVTAPIAYTTSTVYTTSVYTVSSCAPTVTYWHGKINVNEFKIADYSSPEEGSVVTETVSLYTTVCSVTTSTSAPAVQTPTPVPFTTSTVKTTMWYTISECPATKTDCPIGMETSTVSSLTTVCPVSETTGVDAILPPYPTSDIETIVKPYSTGSPIGHPMLPKGNVTIPSVPRITITSGAIMHKADAVLMTVGLTAAAVIAILGSWW